MSGRGREREEEEEKERERGWDKDSRGGDLLYL
jgi:hypothetical protein